MMPKAVIFDWAGTLIDPGCYAPVRAFQTAFGAFGLDVSEALIRRDMGLGKRRHTERLLAEPEITRRFKETKGRLPNSDDCEALYLATIEVMAKIARDYATPVPGAANTLSELQRQGVAIGSTTGYSRHVMDEIIPLAASKGIAPEIIVCAEEVADPRPGPGQIMACLAALGVGPPERVVKVDDAVSGLMAGRAAGCLTIAVTHSGNPVSPSDVAQWADGSCESVAGLVDCLATL